MPASDPLSLTSVRTTSAQVALLLAMSIYYNLFGSLSLGDFYENDQLSEKKLGLFRKRLECILSALIPEKNAGKAPKQFQHRIKSLPKGKLKYFDENHRLLISEAALDELYALLASLSVTNDTDVHILNEYVPGKAAPLSASRIGVTSSIFSTISSLLIFSTLLSEDESLFDDSVNDQSRLGVEDASAIGAGILSSAFVVANLLQKLRQDRTYDLSLQYTRSCIAALNTLKENSPSEELRFPKIKDEHYRKACKDGSILGFKGAISSEASKQRSYMTLTTTAVFGVGFLLADIFTGGAFLGLRIGIGLVAAAAVMATRYVTKEAQNKVNLYAKEYRRWITSAFQEELIAELSVYGLQPTNPKQEISSDAVNIERQVSVDVKNFLDQNTGRNMSWIKENIPEQYQRHPYYFLAECEFQLREKAGEDKHMVHAERVALFVQPVDQFFSKKQARGIQYMHDYTMLYQSQRGQDYKWERPYLYQSVPNLADESAVDEKIKRDLAWNPWIYAGRMLRSTEQQEVKRELSWTMGYAYYSATRFLVAPWKNDEKVLDAYYTKRCQAAKKTLMKEQNKEHDGIKATSSDIFSTMLQKDEKRYENEARPFGQKPLKEKHEENMAGIGISSILASGATVFFLAISPLLAYASHMLYVCSEVVSDVICKGAEALTYLGCSSFFKTWAVNQRRKEKTEARYLLPKQPSLRAI